MNRLIEKIVFSGFITAWRLATVPTSLSPESVKATTEGVVRPPSAFSRTVGSPPSKTATHELVVPRSIPIVLPTVSYLRSLNMLKKSKRKYGRSLLCDATGRGKTETAAGGSPNRPRLEVATEAKEERS